MKSIEFVGNPGSGKTTIRNLLAKEFEKMSLKTLDNKKLILYSFIKNSKNNFATYVGIRPEDIKIDSNGMYKVKIETTELLGAETLVSFKSNDINGILLTQENIEFSEGDEIKININQSKILYFDDDEKGIK